MFPKLQFIVLTMLSEYIFINKVLRNVHLKGLEKYYFCRKEIKVQKENGKKKSTIQENGPFKSTGH
jgi:hypothetical protein